MVVEVVVIVNNSHGLCSVCASYARRCVRDAPVLMMDACMCASTMHTGLHVCVCDNPQSASLTGVHDGWDFDSRVVLAGEDAALWMTHALVDLFSSFIPSWSPEDALARERLQRGWTVADQQYQVSRVREAGNWVGWLAAWEAWWSARAADGSAAPDVAGAVPTVADVPNIATPLIVTAAADPGPSDLWTPLKMSECTLVGGC